MTRRHLVDVGVDVDSWRPGRPFVTRAKDAADVNVDINLLAVLRNVRMSGGPPQGVYQRSRPGARSKASTNSISRCSVTRTRRAREVPTRIPPSGLARVSARQSASRSSPPARSAREATRSQPSPSVRQISRPSTTAHNRSQVSGATARTWRPWRAGRPGFPPGRMSVGPLVSRPRLSPPLDLAPPNAAAPISEESPVDEVRAGAATSTRPPERHTLPVWTARH